MAGLPIGFVHDGLFCYQDSEDPTRFWYLAEKPVPDTRTGRPSLIYQGNGLSFLALEANWLPSAKAVATLEAEILRHHPEQDAALLEFALAPPSHVRVEGMTLELADGNDSRIELARSTTTGMPPWRAVFSATLPEDQARRVEQALTGTENLLFLSLSYALVIPVSATAEVTGHVPAPTAAQLAAPGGADPAAALAAALTAGTLMSSVTTVPTGDIGAALAERTLAAALDSARLLLAADIRWRSPRTGKPAASPDVIQISARESESEQIRIPSSSWLVASTDIGAWAAKK